MTGNKKGKKASKILEIALVMGIVFALNIIGNYIYTWVDLTEEKRYTLTPTTRKSISETESPVFIEVLMGGTYPAGFSRLQSSVQELLNQFRSINPIVEYNFTDPSKGTREQVNEFRRELAEDGILPVNLRYGASDNVTEKLIYPFAFIRKGSSYTVINLLEQKIAGISDEENLNNAISLLEYKFVSAIEKLKSPERKLIVFTTGHGELEPRDVLDLTQNISTSYVSKFMRLDSVTQISHKIEVVIVAKPQRPFDDKDKFKLDQYIMNGGKVIFLIDKVNARIDSMRMNSLYIPDNFNLNLDDMLFKYGVRINDDLVMDLECSDLVLVIGREAGRPQLDRFNWYYDPVVAPKSNHPIVKGLDRINFRFASSMDTIKTALNTRKNILLATSDNSRLQFSPIRLTFDIIRNPPRPELFNKSNIPVGVLLEGELGSLYANRITPEMKEGLSALGQQFKDSTSRGKVLVFSDGDLIRNDVNPTSGEVSPLGYNRSQQYTFANKPLLINAIEYLVDDKGVIDARSKTVKLRLLDIRKVDEEKSYWRSLNIAVPLIFVVLFGILYNFIRRKRFVN